VRRSHRPAARNMDLLKVRASSWPSAYYHYELEPIENSQLEDIFPSKAINKLRNNLRVTFPKGAF